MKTVAEIVAAIIFLVAMNYIAPKVVYEFKKDTLHRVNHGIPKLKNFTKQLTGQR